MIKKLQVECGHNTVNKIKTMLQDMIKSQQVVAEFRSSKGGSNIENIEFSTEILTSGHWPYQDLPKCKIPKQMIVVSEQFTQYYKSKFQNREINWLYNHGSVQVATTYLNKNY